MAAKYFFIAMILISLSLISCRQGEDLNTEEATPTSAVDKALLKGEDQSTQSRETDSQTEIQHHSSSYKDSLLINMDLNDPPKSGTHWKVK